MKFSSLFRVEFGRLLRNRTTLLAAALTALAPLAGYSFYLPSFGDSMAALYLANPMLAGGIAGTLFFGLLVLVTLDRTVRTGAAALMETTVSPTKKHTAQLLAVLSCAALTSLAISLLYLPYTVWKLNIVFSLPDYWLAAVLFLMSGLVVGTLVTPVSSGSTRRLGGKQRRNRQLVHNGSGDRSASAVRRRLRFHRALHRKRNAHPVLLQQKISVPPGRRSPGADGTSHRILHRPLRPPLLYRR